MLFFRYRRESIIVIKTKYLSISFGNKMGLKPIDMAVCTNYGCINPTTTNNRKSISELQNILGIKT